MRRSATTMATRALLACLLGSITATAQAQQPEEQEQDEQVSEPATPDAPPPKVAVVVVGDPDEVLRAEAVRIEQALDSSDALTLPADPALRRALRGEPAPDEDDGLGRARRERRQLGLGEQDDLPVLTSLGRMAGAAAVVAVRRRGATIEAVVVDVERQSFFEGELDAGMSSDDELVGFVRSRALAAQRAAGSSASSASPADASTAGEATTGDGAGAGDEGARPTGEGGLGSPTGDEPAPGDDEDDDGGFFDEWPLIVAGALLLGAVLYFTLQSSPAEPGPPVLRFVPGGR